ncbi:molybdenum cofactor guanylyltransferase [Macrococcus equipercicus]|uniref:Molybdenum cofactor guanylyltransferase n=1 Tax=Macrococcus equipercicus TaxID=69967 RepID=A0A9Q9BNW3_9STAP|nr:molybdenum cofactor guanylyltransferase [Macrococcus equipercicus]KAA1039634.1 molybdenum cofactor guanylyltransferase [Macrococcus equipercicus]UTH13965.1 molybdenum cofactor guanylyltransferase [Macrococcus equipercicus]
MIAIILAGGESRRFGSQKAFYELDSEPFYKCVAQTLELSGQFDKLVISSNEAIAERFQDYPVVIDQHHYKNRGPLAGIYSVMTACPADAYLVISVDTPFITTAALHHLIKQYEGQLTVYRDDSQIHGTIGIYPHHLKAVIKQLLDNDKLALRHLFNENTDYIDVAAVPGNWYANINTMNELAIMKEGERDD